MEYKLGEKKAMRNAYGETLVELGKKYPNLAKEALRYLFNTPKIKNSKLKVAIPRVLNMYSLAPFFVGFFESLNISLFLKYISPSFGFKSEQKIFKRVDLPQPLIPIIAIDSF